MSVRQPWRSCMALLGCIAVLACGSPASGTPDDGTLVDGVYRNTYFGFSLTVPKTWSVPPTKAQEQVMETGKAALVGEDPLRKAAIETSAKSTYQLLMINKHPLGAPVPFNPGLILMAEDVSHLPGITSGKDYLYHVTRLLTVGQLPLEQVSEAHQFVLGGKEFYRADFVLKQAAMEIRQSYLATIIEGYALGLVMTVVDDADSEELEGVAASLTFD